MVKFEFREARFRQRQQALLIEIAGTSQPQQIAKELDRRGVKGLDNLGKKLKERVKAWNSGCMWKELFRSPEFHRDMQQLFQAARPLRIGR